MVTYGCESWTVKKAECWRTDAFELWRWKRLLRLPCTARRSILREINPEYSLEGLMLKLKLHYFGHLMRTADSLEKSLMLGMTEGRRRRQHQRMRWLDHWCNGHELGQTSRDSEGKKKRERETVRDREAWHAAVPGVIKSQDWASEHHHHLYAESKRYNKPVTVTKTETDSQIQRAS